MFFAKMLCFAVFCKNSGWFFPAGTRKERKETASVPLDWFRAGRNAGLPAGQFVRGRTMCGRETATAYGERGRRKGIYIEEA